jgi:hypothetical protein
VRISPDGRRIAFRAPVDGVLNLWVAPIDQIGDARPVTAVADRNLGPWISGCTTTGRSYSSVRRPATKIGVFGVPMWKPAMYGRSRQDLGDLLRSAALAPFSGELLIAHNARDKRFFDVYRVNVATGESTLLQLNEAFFYHFSDQQFRVRFATCHTDGGDIEYLQHGPDGERTLSSRIGTEDTMVTRAIEFSACGSELYWLDSRGRDTAAVVAQDLASAMMRVLAEDPRADFTELLLDLISERPAAAVHSFERVAWEVLDAEYRDDFAFLIQQSRGNLTIASMSQDGRHWIAAYQYDDSPMEYFHYDGAARTPETCLPRLRSNTGR